MNDRKSREKKTIFKSKSVPGKEIDLHKTLKWNDSKKGKPIFEINKKYI